MQSKTSARIRSLYHSLTKCGVDSYVPVNLVMYVSSRKQKLEAKKLVVSATQSCLIIYQSKTVSMVKFIGFH